MFYVTGDIHGVAEDFVARTSRLALGTDDILLCLGDVGLKYGDYLSADLRQVMAELPCKVLVMRGNHDVRYCRELESGEYGSAVERLLGGTAATKAHPGLAYEDWGGIVLTYDTAFPNIAYLPDGGGLFSRNGLNCLVMPGAWSIDGYYRMIDGSPFEWDEKLFPAEALALAELVKERRIDYVFSHTGPFAWEPEYRDLFFSGMPQHNVDKSMERFFDEIMEHVERSCRGWYFGHFHDDRPLAGGMGHMLYSSVEKLPELA